MYYGVRLRFLYRTECQRRLPIKISKSLKEAEHFAQPFFAPFQDLRIFLTAAVPLSISARYHFPRAAVGSCKIPHPAVIK